METEEAVKASFERMWAIRCAIVAEHEKTGHEAGILACPICGTGKVYWRRARSNGHIHARCTTPDCASWME